MEIPEKGPLQSPPLPNRSAEVAPHSVGESSVTHGGTGQNDTVNLTASGREFKAAAEHAQRLPEIREERIMQLRRQLEEGTYRVQGHQIALNMINETQENNHLLNHIDTQACTQPTGPHHECEDH
jgi:flagellar biosynthesis anti-sigma factor FlgM